MSASQRNVDLPASSQLVESLLANQAKEIEIKKQAEDNKKQNLKYNYELAKQSLQVQLEDRREQRAHQKDLWKWFMWFAAFLILVVSVFVCWALYLGKETFLLEIIRALFYGGSGFCAGMSLRKMKKDDPVPPQE